MGIAALLCGFLSESLCVLLMTWASSCFEVDHSNIDLFSHFLMSVTSFLIVKSSIYSFHFSCVSVRGSWILGKFLYILNIIVGLNWLGYVFQTALYFYNTTHISPWHSSQLIQWGSSLKCWIVRVEVLKRNGSYVRVLLYV